MKDFDQWLDTFECELYEAFEVQDEHDTFAAFAKAAFKEYHEEDL